MHPYETVSRYDVHQSMLSLYGNPQEAATLGQANLLKPSYLGSTFDNSRQPAPSRNPAVAKGLQNILQSAQRKIDQNQQNSLQKSLANYLGADMPILGSVGRATA